MATIQKVKNKSGISFRVLIRKIGHQTISKTFKSKSLALKFASELELNSEYRQQYLNKNLTFEDLAKRYLKTANLGTRPKQKIAMTQYWIEELSGLKVGDITSPIISTSLNKLKDKYSNATINRYKAAISVVYNFAIRSSLVNSNPITQIASWTEHNARTRFLSDSERSRLLSACKGSKWKKLYPLVLLAITTGARRSELMKLTWSDICLKRNLAYLKTSKNHEPRTLPLTNSVCRELLKLDRHHQLVFHSDRIPSKPYDFTKLWKKALRKAEINDFRFHDLRHTCASYLAQGGASLLEIAEILGHRQIQMTKRYAHLCITHKKQLISKHFGNME